MVKLPVASLSVLGVVGALLVASGCGESALETIVIVRDAPGGPDTGTGGDADGSGGKDEGAVDPGEETDRGTVDGDGDGGADGGVPVCAEDGEFGCPCTTHEDCFSGWCVEGPRGSICTRECSEGCAEGFHCKIVVVVDPVSLCIPYFNDVCDPCQSDVDCPDGACLTIEGEGRCGLTCDPEGDGSDCAEGQVCAPDPTGEREGAWCQPRGGSCACTMDDAGLAEPKRRACAIEVPGVGVCVDFQICEPGVGWGACQARTPEAESCDGVDNDCDGLADNGLVAPDGGVCTVINGFGTCEGEARCGVPPSGGEVQWWCDAQEPTEESCNYRDDDCDGTTDEGFDELFATCTAGEGMCKRFGFEECTPEGDGTSCNAVAAPAGEEICDGLDNDCDGQTDEAAQWGQKGQPCTAGEGVCEATGIYACDADDLSGPLVCNVALNPAGSEICDNLDNDCDGQTDEGAAWDDKGAVCTVGQGACLRAGVKVCDLGAPGGPTVCSAAEGDAGLESCNDVDDDCDGQTDEDWPEKGQSCTAGEGICARSGVVVCAAGGGGATCNAQAATGNDVESCDYADDDCDGATDEDFVDAGGRYVALESCGSCGNDCGQYWNEAEHHALPFCDTAPATPRCDFTCVTAPLAWADADGIPDDGCEMPLDPAAIYVSMPANGGLDSPGCGGWVDPCASIGQGILRAAGDVTKDKVYVSAGAYYEKVVLEAGVDVLGGFNPVNWVQDRDINLTVIYGDSGPGHVAAVDAVGIDQHTVFEGFVIQAPTATGPSSNSYGIYVLGSGDDLTIRDVTIYAGAAGRGQSGSDGEAGDAGVSAAGPFDGGSACDDALFEASPGADIPDHDDSGLAATIDVSTACTLESLAVSVAITHDWVGDLFIELKSPAGTTVRLHNQGSFGADLAGTYEETLTVTGPGGFADFIGEDIQGTWTLTVIDPEPLFTGTLDYWALHFNIPGQDLELDATVTDGTPCTGASARQRSNGGVLACGGDDVSGGDGGGNQCPPVVGSEASGLDGASGEPGDGALGGDGGTGGDAGDDGDAQGDTCTCSLPEAGMGAQNGVNGADGTSGAAGEGCASSLGKVTAGHWVGALGGDGANGGHGGGGGGGGAGGGGLCTAEGACCAADRLGGHGGGGGSGACAGTHGTGGASGGSSFGIIIIGGTPPVISGVEVFLGSGGSGGSGGAGGSGGVGGRGGAGGKCFGSCWCSASGGKGGEGGNGGHGGGGGGGCGGNAFGIYTYGMAGAADYCGATSDNSFSGGQSGVAGTGGASLGAAGGDGTGGTVESCSYR